MALIALYKVGQKRTGKQETVLWSSLLKNEKISKRIIDENEFKCAIIVQVMPWRVAMANVMLEEEDEGTGHGFKEFLFTILFHKEQQ